MKNRLIFFLAVLIIIFQVMVVMPASIWIHNQFNFSAAFWKSLEIPSLVLVLGGVFSLIISWVIPQKLKEYLLPLLAVTSVCIFVQQNVLVWNYGILNGEKINFSSNHLRGVIDILVWLVGIISLIKFRKRILEKSGTIITFAGIATSLLLANILFSSGADTKTESYSITEEEKFSFSKDRNIILFVLDGFQSDLFWEIYDSDPRLLSELTGFTFYPNTSSVFAKTYPTIPLLLTGKRYQKKESIREFIQNVYDDSLPSQLIDKGWDVRLFPYVQSTIAVKDSVMSNSVAHYTIFKSWITTLELWTYLFSEPRHIFSNH